jgi:hypothetical protein
VLADVGKLLYSAGGSAINYTIPPDSIAEPFRRGNTIVIVNEGAGLVTLVAGAGVTINSAPGLISGGQFAVFGLRKTSTANTWIAFGNLTSS